MGKSRKEKQEIIKDTEQLNSRFEAFAKSVGKAYLLALEPYTGRVMQKLYSLGLLPSFVKGRKKRLVLNLCRAEAHRDILLRALGKDTER